MGYGYDSSRVRRVFASVTASSTDAVLLPAQAGSSVRVLALTAVASSATAITVNSKGSGAGTAISPAMTAAAGAINPNWQYCPEGWVETFPGEALTVTTGSGATTAIHAVLVLVPATDDILLAAESGELLLTEDNQTLSTERS